MRVDDVAGNVTWILLATSYKMPFNSRNEGWMAWWAVFARPYRSRRCRTTLRTSPSRARRRRRTAHPAPPVATSRVVHCAGHLYFDIHQRRERRRRGERMRTRSERRRRAPRGTACESTLRAPSERLASSGCGVCAFRDENLLRVPFFHQSHCICIKTSDHVHDTCRSVSVKMPLRVAISYGGVRREWGCRVHPASHTERHGVATRCRGRRRTPGARVRRRRRRSPPSPPPTSATPARPAAPATTFSSPSSPTPAMSRRLNG